MCKSGSENHDNGTQTLYSRIDQEPSLCSRSTKGERALNMGQANCAPFRDVWYGPELRPDWKKEPTFDPLVGFPNGRKIRDPKVTLEEMDAHLLPLKRRDYCAYMYIKFLDCRRDNKWPYLPCDLVFQDFQACEHEDFVLRMKEYERERRLMVREARIKSKMARGDM